MKGKIELIERWFASIVSGCQGLLLWINWNLRGNDFFFMLIILLFCSIISFLPIALAKRIYNCYVTYKKYYCDTFEDDFISMFFMYLKLSMITMSCALIVVYLAKLVES